MYKVIDKIVSVEDYDKYIKPKLNENLNLNEVYFNDRHFILKGSNWEDSCWYERQSDEFVAEIKTTIKEFLIKSNLLNFLDKDNPLCEEVKAIPLTHREFATHSMSIPTHIFYRFDKNVLFMPNTKISAGEYVEFDTDNNKINFQLSKAELEQKFVVSEPRFLKLEAIIKEFDKIKVDDMMHLGDNYDNLCSLIYKSATARLDYFKVKELSEEFNEKYSEITDKYTKIGDKLDDKASRIKSSLTAKELLETDLSLLKERYVSYCDKEFAKDSYNKDKNDIDRNNKLKSEIIDDYIEDNAPFDNDYVDNYDDGSDIEY